MRARVGHDERPARCALGIVETNNGPPDAVRKSTRAARIARLLVLASVWSHTWGGGAASSQMSDTNVGCSTTSRRPTGLPHIFHGGEMKETLRKLQEKRTDAKGFTLIELL